MNKIFLSVLSLFLLIFISTNLTFAQTGSTTDKSILDDPLFKQNVRDPIYLVVTNINFNNVELAGDKIKIIGYFEIENRTDYVSPDFNYSIFGVLRDIENFVDYPNYIDSKSEILKLNPREKIRIEFNTEIKNHSDFGSMLINIRLESPSGEKFANNTKEIPNTLLNSNTPNINDNKIIYTNLNSEFDLNSEKFFINEGPTFYPENEDLYLRISSTSTDNINSFNAKLFIFEETYFSKSIYEESYLVKLDNEKKDSEFFSIKMPENFEPGVYPIRIDFESSSPDYFVPSMYGRYIIGGNIINVNDVYFEEGKDFKDFVVSVQGTPIDLRNQNSYGVSKNFDLEIILKDKRGNTLLLEQFTNNSVLVNNKINISLNDKVDFDKVYNITTNVKQGDKILDSYSKDVYHEKNNLLILIFSILALIIFLMLMILLRKKMKEKNIILPLFFIFFFFSFNTAQALVTPTPTKQIGFIRYYTEDFYSGTYSGYPYSGDYTDRDIYRNDNVLDLFGVNLSFEYIDECINSGTIFPVKVTVEYGLCGNAAPVPGSDGRPENYSGLKLALSKNPNDWYWETNQYKIGTTTATIDDNQVDVPDSVFISEPEDWGPFDIEKLSNLLDTAVSGSSESTLQQSDYNDFQIDAVADYIYSFFSTSPYFNGSPDFSEVTNGANNILSGSGTASYSLIAPEPPGTKDYWVHISFNAKMTGGEMVRVDYVASIPIQICSPHDACTLMPGVQYVDNEGVLRDESGNRMDDYTVQVRETTRTTYNHLPTSLIIKNWGKVWGGNTTPKNEFELVTVCNYCGGSDISDSLKPSSLYTFINSWVNVEKNMGGDSLNTKLQRDNYSIFLGKIDNYKRPQTIFSTFFYKLDDPWGTEQYFAREKNPINLINSDYIKKDYLITDNTNGLKFYDLEAINPHVDLYGINSFESLNPPFYSFSQIFSFIWNMNFREIYATGSGTLTGEGFNSSNISLVKEKIVDSTGSGSSCSLYQDFCADKNGIQYLLQNTDQNYMELWNMLADNSRQLVGHTNVGDYSKNSVEALCTLIPNIGLNATCSPGPFDNATTTINTNFNFTITPSGGDNLLGYQYGWPSGTTTSNMITQQYSATGTQSFSVPVQNGASTANAVCSIQVVDDTGSDPLTVYCNATNEPVEAGNDVIFEAYTYNNEGNPPLIYDWENIGETSNSSQVYPTSNTFDSVTRQVTITDSDGRQGSASCTSYLMSCGSAASPTLTAPTVDNPNLCNYNSWFYDWDGINEITNGSGDITGWGWNCDGVSQVNNGYSCFAPKNSGGGNTDVKLKIMPKIYPSCKAVFTGSKQVLSATETCELIGPASFTTIQYATGTDMAIQPSPVNMPKGVYTLVCKDGSTEGSTEIIRSSDVCISNPTTIEQ